MRIDTDINLADTVYIDHKQYEVKQTSTNTKLNHYGSIQTTIEFNLNYTDDKNNKPGVFPTEYSRTDFMTQSEYRDSLINLVNSLGE